MLLVTPQIPYPPRKGTTARNFNILKHLAGNHEVHLLTFEENEGQEPPAALQEVCAEVHLVSAYSRPTVSRARDLFLQDLFLHSTPDLALRLASSEMTGALEQLLRDGAFDLVQIEGLEMTIHWERLRNSGRIHAGDLPIMVFDDHNCEYLLQKRAFEIDRLNAAKWHGALYSLLQWHRLTAFEAHIVSLADGVIVVSEEDAAAVSTIANPRLVGVVQNGIDVEFFARTDDRLKLTSGGLHLVFTGTMDYRPNVDAVTWFCRHIFSEVRKAVPDTKLWIVGLNPKEEVKRLSRLDGVVVTGFVEDVRPFLDRASAYVVPLRFGGGTRFKVLEAMASSLPVVSTSLGYQGIRATDGVDLLVADGANDFARAVVNLLSNASLRQSLGSNALKLVAQKYDWKVILPKIDDLYDDLLCRRRGASKRGNA
ncbi:MAG: glycosyltransferase [Chloroflexi bacterium]|nr:glycosyltransferase [Chloroflexota bacterium]